MQNSKISFKVASILFVLSGIAALIYQVTWFKYLSYFLGNGTYAQAIVLATFMGGLALGAWIFGKKSDRSKNPFKLFAWLEITIAIYCFFYEPIFNLIKEVFIHVVSANEWASDSTKTLLLSFLASASALIIPTTLMGGTLPVLVKCLSQKVKDIGKNVALLYFINSLGAVIGSMIAGFYLIVTFGLQIATYFGAALDLIVGLVFLIFTTVPSPLKETKINTSVQSESKPIFSIDRKKKNTVLLVAGLSGLAAMMYEVVWLRLLIPVLSSTTYSFTIILTVFITGITIGSLLIYYLFRFLKKPMLFLGICQFMIVVSVMISITFYDKIPYYIWQDVGPAESTDQAYLGYLATQCYYVFLLLIVPTIFMGMSLPLAAKLLASNIKKSGEEVGAVFGINTIGTVVGSLVAGLVLIPLIGLRHTLECAIGINVLCTFFIFQQVKEIKLFGKLTTVGIIVLLCTFYFSQIKEEQWARGIMTSQIARQINQKKAPKSYAEFIEGTKKDNSKIVYYNEGVAGTIVVCQTDKSTALYTNGKSDANSVGDLRTQSALGHVPLILHPQPDSVFVIGFGAGHTIGSVMVHEKVKFAEVAEISPEVIEASNFFTHVNQQPLENPNLHLIKNDGVAALRVAPHQYDVIISQPSNPWSAGVGNLFTKEFFSDCKKKLRPGGYVAQWFGLYEMSEQNLKLILRTALSEFEHIEIWALGPNDILLLCSETPFNFDIDALEKNYAEVQDVLAVENIGIHSFPIFLSQQFLSNTNALKTYVGNGPLNTENQPLLEFWGPRSYFKDEYATVFPTISDWKNYSQSNLLLKKYRRINNLSFKDIVDISHFKADHGTKGNKVFQEHYTVLSGSYATPKNRSSKLPTNLFIGKLNSHNEIIPLSKANPYETITSWMCCGTVDQNQMLTYKWTSPSNKVLTENIEYKAHWNYSWNKLNSPAPLEIGNWQLEVEANGELLATKNIVVDASIPVTKFNFPHNKILVGVKNKQSIQQLIKVHPMQKIVVSTSGPAYGYKETVNIVWTTPSGKKIKQLFNYLEYYETSWWQLDAPYPLEEGKWSVQIESFTGSPYLKTRFLVSSSAPLLP